MSFYLQNARIVKTDTPTTLENAVIVVRDDRIAYAGDSSCAPNVPSGAEIIDMGGRIVMPAMVNAHTHSAMTLFRGAADDLPLHRWLNERIWPMEARLDEEAVYWGSMLAIAEMIAGGVAAFNDMYFLTEQTVRAVEQTHLRATLPLAMTCDSQDPDVIAAKLRPAVALFEKYHGCANGRIRVTIAPHAEYTCSPGFLKACGEEAKRLGASIHIHISETIQEHEDCKARHGKTPVALLKSLGVLDVPVLAAHCVFVEPEDMRIMAEHGVTVLHCPGSNLKLGSGIAPIPQLMKAGVNVALGTDSAASNNNLSMIEEMQLAALLHKGVARDAVLINAAQAFTMATKSGAKALHTGGGEVAAGQKADLTAIDIHRPHMTPVHNALGNVVYSAQSGDVWMTMVDGKILFKAGNYYTLDLERVIEQATQCAARITVDNASPQ